MSLVAPAEGKVSTGGRDTVALDPPGDAVAQSIVRSTQVRSTRYMNNDTYFQTEVLIDAFRTPAMLLI